MIWRPSDRSKEPDGSIEIDMTACSTEVAKFMISIEVEYVLGARTTMRMREDLAKIAFRRINDHDVKEQYKVVYII